MRAIETMGVLGLAAILGLTSGCGGMRALPRPTPNEPTP